MSDVLIRAENVSKKFCRSLKRSMWYGLCDMVSEAAGRLRQHDRLRVGEFWALRNVSFELRRGECLGLIGHNGAGKTTLLKMLNGLIKPDSGRITMRGRVGALIALGAGFNPLLTGRENIYVNASVLGLSRREIASRIEEIIEFAEIGDFIDSPVRSYSSGMNVRLGFAVASTLDPDVLLLDEVLAVGDVGFRFKCANRVRQIMNRAAVVFVSHSMEAISQLCTVGVVMHRGQVARDGSVTEVIAEYFRLSNVSSQQASGELVQSNHTRNVSLVVPSTIETGTPLEMEARLWYAQPCSRADILITLLNQELSPVAYYSSRNSGEAFQLQQGDNTLRIRTGRLRLRPGIYRLDICLHDARANQYIFRSYAQQTCRVLGEVAGFAPYIVENPA